MRRRLSPGHGLLLLWAACVALPARADDSALVWQPGWQRFELGHYLLTGAGFGLALAKYPVGPLRAGESRGGWWVDEGVRDALRVHSASGRDAALVASDVTLALTLAQPFVDALVVANLVHDSPDVGAQLALISAEVLAVTMAVQAVFNVSVSRERPYARDCGGSLAEGSRACMGDNRYFSFFSGHTSQTFAAAAVSCGHHLRLPLYGGGAPEVVACVGGFALASTTAVLRIAGDRHYFTDVLVGAGAGTLIGFGLPWLLHYRHGARQPAATRAPLGLARLALLPTPTGVLLDGAY
jgi:membrane-associated phospholipid phosphatase